MSRHFIWFLLLTLLVYVTLSGAKSLQKDHQALDHYKSGFAQDIANEKVASYRSLTESSPLSKQYLTELIHQAQQELARITVSERSLNQKKSGSGLSRSNAFRMNERPNKYSYSKSGESSWMPKKSEVPPKTNWNKPRVIAAHPKGWKPDRKKRSFKVTEELLDLLQESVAKVSERSLNSQPKPYGLPIKVPPSQSSWGDYSKVKSPSGIFQWMKGQKPTRAPLLGSYQRPNFDMVPVDLGNLVKKSRPSNAFIKKHYQKRPLKY